MQAFRNNMGADHGFQGLIRDSTVVCPHVVFGDDRMGLLATTLFGVGGALIAKYVGLAMGWYHEGELLGFVASLARAIVLLTLYSLLRPKKKV